MSVLTHKKAYGVYYWGYPTYTLRYRYENTPERQKALEGLKVYLEWVFE